MLHFLPYAKIFRVQGGMAAWPKRPNGKYATDSECHSAVTTVSAYSQRSVQDLQVYNYAQLSLCVK